jgi:hypothetical protein
MISLVIAGTSPRITGPIERLQRGRVICLSARKGRDFARVRRDLWVSPNTKEPGPSSGSQLSSEYEILAPRRKGGFVYRANLSETTPYCAVSELKTVEGNLVRVLLPLSPGCRMVQPRPASRARSAACVLSTT